MFNPIHIQKTIAAACLLLVLTLCGCTTMDWSKGLDWDLPWSEDNKPQIPTRVVAMWTDTVMQQSGERGVRGFGGRLMFYAKGREQPVKVDGNMTVFAFADNGLNPTTTVPEKKFIFLPEQLKKYYSESELGHSYSIWLPWDEVGGMRRKISLVVKFESKEGASIISEPSLQRLPGMEPGPESQEAAAQNTRTQTNRLAAGGIRRVAHEEPADTTKKLHIFTTETISIPPSFIGSSRSQAARFPSGSVSGAGGVAVISPGSPAEAEYPVDSEAQPGDSQPLQLPAQTSTPARPSPGRVTMPPFQIKQRYRPEPPPRPYRPNASVVNQPDAAASPLGLPAVIAD